jgi:hypothetical protein
LDREAVERRVDRLLGAAARQPPVSDARIRQVIDLMAREPDRIRIPVLKTAVSGPYFAAPEFQRSRPMKKTSSLLSVLLLAGCTTLPPKNPANVCSIFREKEDWYAATRKAQQRWGVPVPVQMAIINQESSYVEDARPPRYRFLGFIPLWRPTSAYGYGQATDSTWEWYRNTTGNSGADRDEFEDAADFVGWYGHQSYTQLGIPKHDAYRQYLAYHEGHGGYKRRTHAKKAWLLKVARDVQAVAGRYRRQLGGCQAELDQALASGD